MFLNPLSLRGIMSLRGFQAHLPYGVASGGRSPPRGLASPLVVPFPLLRSPCSPRRFRFQGAFAPAGKKPQLLSVISLTHFPISATIRVARSLSLSFPLWCPMSVIVCGGRSFSGPVASALAASPVALPSLVLGGCPSGADALALAWAASRSLRVRSFPARWGMGRFAGPARNFAMVRSAGVTAALAFPGGRGTASLVRLALRAGLPVWSWDGSWVRVGQPVLF